MLIAVGGRSGSGKTNIAKMLIADLGSEFENILFISMDNFYKETNGDMNYNYDHPDAFDWGLIDHTLKTIKTGTEPIKIPIYNYSQSRQSGQFNEYKPPYQCVIFEGILALHEKIHKYFDLTIYIDAASDVCLWRRIKRDYEERGRSIEACGIQYFTVTKKGAETYIEPLKQNANFILPNNALDEIKKGPGYLTLLKYIKSTLTK